MFRAYCILTFEAEQWSEDKFVPNKIVEALT